MEITSPFFWGAGGAQLSPEEIAKRRQIEDALLARGIDTSPVGDWTQGVARVADAIAGAFRRGRLDRAEANNDAMNRAASAELAAVYGGAGQFPPAPGQNTPAEAAVDATIAPLDTRQVRPPAAASPVSYAPLADGADWLSYGNQGATRNQPLSERLTGALGSFLPEMGVTMKVFSGGQDATGPNRTGSHRHDHGNAADVFFYKDGRQLDWANPQDLPVFEDIVRRGKAAGITGFGAGDGYMQRGSMHLGFGSPAVWGAGGQGSNAPDWLRNAFNSKDAANVQLAQVTQPSAADLSRIPAMAGGSGDGFQASQASGMSPAIINAMTNPNLSPQVRAVAEAMFQKQMQDNDPLRQLQIQAARKALAAQPKQWQRLDDRTLFDATTGETRSVGGDGAGDIFDTKSVEGQSLNWLVKNGKLTMEQAAQIGAGKTITDPSTGAVIFMTPQGVFGQAPGAGAPQPLTPAQQPPPAGSPSLSAPSAGSAATPSTAASPGQASTRQGMIPLTDAKSSRKPPTEAQQRNQQLYTVVRPELETIEKNFPALSDPKNQAWASLPIGSDYMTTPEFQQARNSLKTIIASYLYSVSGATAAPQEVENQASVLTPKIGEAKASVNDKLARIRTMVNAIKNNRGDIVDPSDGGAKKKTSTGIEWSVEP